MSASRGAGDRGGFGSATPTASLPTLIAALPGDHTRAPQTEFIRARQVLFIENLSTTGSARSAAAAAGVSHQTAYRARRSCAQFRLAWDAALVAARRCAEDALACRAIDGVEEQVFYHGEVVATRRRYSDRLLLAHLARLDALQENPRAAAFAGDWDAAMARFAAGDAPLPDEGENFSSGPCNTWSMSRAGADPDDDETDADYEDSDEANEDADDDGIDWDDDDAANAELDRIQAAMDADRPAAAPRLDADDPHGLIADAQFEAFQRGVPRWWLVLPPVPDGGGGAWRYAETGTAPPPPPTPPAGPESAAGDEPEDKLDAEPAPEPVVEEPEAGQEPESERQHRAPYRTWYPINDGRLQPY